MRRWQGFARTEFSRAEVPGGTEFRVTPEPISAFIDIKKALMIGVVVFLLANVMLALFDAAMAFALGGGMAAHLPWITRAARRHGSSSLPNGLNRTGEGFPLRTFSDSFCATRGSRRSRV